MKRQATQILKEHQFLNVGAGGMEQHIKPVPAVT